MKEAAAKELSKCGSVCSTHKFQISAFALHIKISACEKHFLMPIPRISCRYAVLCLCMLTKSGRWRKYNMTFQILLLLPAASDSSYHFAHFITTHIAGPLKIQMCTFSSTRPTAQSCALAFCPRRRGNDESLNWDFRFGAALAGGNISNPFLCCRFYDFLRRLLSHSLFEKQTTVHQILSENSILENIFSAHILTNENPFSFCLRKSFCCPPSDYPCRCSPRFWKHTIHTPFVIRSNSTTRFLYQNKFPWQAIFVLRSSTPLLHLRIHVHLFSRKIQKQRSEQPSLCCSSHDGEYIDFAILGTERSRDERRLKLLGGHLNGNYGSNGCYRQCRFEQQENISSMRRWALGREEKATEIVGGWMGFWDG